MDRPNPLVLVDAPPSSTAILEHETDGALVALSALGDTAAFAVLVHRYEALMRRYALRTLGSSSEADDALQDALIVAWDKLGTVRNPDAVKSWLMRIVYHKCIDRLRAATNEDVVLDEAFPANGDYHPSEVVIDGLRSAALKGFLFELPVNQRRAWLMRGFNECSYSDIAAELGVADSTVRGLLARARQSIGRDMEPWR